MYVSLSYVSFMFYISILLNIHVPPLCILFCVCWASLVVYVVSPARSSIHYFIISSYFRRGCCPSLPGPRTSKSPVTTTLITCLRISRPHAPVFQCTTGAYRQPCQPVYQPINVHELTHPKILYNSSFIS